MNKVHVIVNPFSARGRTGQRWHLIRAAISQAFREFKYIFTEKPSQATTLARELLRDGFDLIIGVGGDGTINEIANGFFHETERQSINEEAAMSVVPSGTGSDFIRFLKIPRDFRRSVDHIKNASVRSFDVGRINFHPSSGPEAHRYFVNVADFGLGAEVVRHLAQTNPQKRSSMTYYRGLLATLMCFRAAEVSITIDDRQAFRGRYLIGAVANGPIFGGGMIIAPGAKADDGCFDLTLVQDMGKLQIIGNTPRLYRGTIARNPKVSIIKAKKIRVEAGEPVAVECDGELCGSLPAEFEIFPRRLNFRI